MVGFCSLDPDHIRAIVEDRHLLDGLIELSNVGAVHIYPRRVCVYCVDPREAEIRADPWGGWDTWAREGVAAAVGCLRDHYALRAPGVEGYV